MANLDEAFDVPMRWAKTVLHQNNRYLSHNKICTNCNIKLIPITNDGGSISMCTRCMKRYDFRTPCYCKHCGLDENNHNVKHVFEWM